jgi:hypothetical protein
MALIRLSDAIENLRAELAHAQEHGKGKNLQFGVGSIELELEVVAENETSGGAKINWWIFGGGVDAKAKDASKHKLKLTLEAVDASGKPLRVSRQQHERPE